MSEAVVSAVLDELPGLAGEIHLISLTGGEPFLLPDLMNRIGEKAGWLGISTGAVTSGYWARNAASAKRMLERVPNVSDVTVSCDEYHLEFVPVDVVENAVQACQKAGRRVSVRVSLPPQSEESTPILAQLRQRFGDIVHTQEVVPFGRAASLGLLERTTSDVPATPCMSGGPHVCTDGEGTPCCSSLAGQLPQGHPLAVGNVRELGLVRFYARSKSNALLNHIRIWGFTEVVKMLRESAPRRYEAMEFGFEDQCALCARLMEDTEAVALMRDWVNQPAHLLGIAACMKRFLGEGDMMRALLEHEAAVVRDLLQTVGRAHPSRS